VVIPTLLDYLRRHPIRCSNESILLGRQCTGKLARNPEIRELYFPASGKKDVRGCIAHKLISFNRRKSQTFDISVELSFRMQVLQTSEQFPYNNRDVFFAEHARLHLTIKNNGINGPVEDGC
jgi:hypothetical protein